MPSKSRVFWIVRDILGVRAYSHKPDKYYSTFQRPGPYATGWFVRLENIGHIFGIKIPSGECRQFKLVEVKRRKKK